MLKFPTMPALSSKEESELIIRAKEGDKKALDRLVIANLPFVIYCSKTYYGQGLSPDELISEGVCGLIQCINRFDVSKGVKLCTYAKYWIRLAIQKALQHNTSDTVSLDIPVSDSDSEATLVSLLQDDSNPLTDEAGTSNLQIEQILKVLKTLKPMEQKVIKMHHGLSPYKKEMSFQEIANVTGLSKARMQQIENVALAKIRRTLGIK